MGKGKMLIISITFLVYLLFFLCNSTLSHSSNVVQFEGQLEGNNCSGGEERVEEDGDEGWMESEFKRRSLWAAAAAAAAPGKRYISYEALRGDNVPCTRPGIPYYNCRALPKANPYTRGCSVITGCARGD